MTSADEVTQTLMYEGWHLFLPQILYCVDRSVGRKHGREEGRKEARKCGFNCWFYATAVVA